MGYFRHESSFVDEGAVIGEGTKIWHFCHVASGARIGAGCALGQNVYVAPTVVIGDGVRIQNNVSLYDGVIVEDHAFIGPSAVFTNDSRPRSKRRLETYPQTVLKQGCTLGASSTTLPGITIGRWAMVGAGSIVTHDVPDHALVVGSPARWRAWVCRCGGKLISTTGRLLTCACGRSYEQIAENQLKAVDGCLHDLPGSRHATEFSEAIIKGNGHPVTNACCS